MHSCIPLFHVFHNPGASPAIPQRWCQASILRWNMTQQSCHCVLRVSARSARCKRFWQRRCARGCLGSMHCKELFKSLQKQHCRIFNQFQINRPRPALVAVCFRSKAVLLPVVKFGLSLSVAGEALPVVL